MVRFGLRPRFDSRTRWIALALAALFSLSLFARSAIAQDTGTGDTIGAGNTSGVAVDAEGVLRQTTVADPTGALARQRVQEALSRLDRNVARPSKLRKISLTRLERELAKRIAAGEGADDVMRNLAGLTRVQYVFCYPDSGDVVIAGPAEAWGVAPSDRMLGKIGRASCRERVFGLV